MKERRVGPDTIMRIIEWIAIIIWVIFLFVFILLILLSPTNAGMQASRPGLRSSGQWVITTIYLLLIIQLILGISGVVFNLTRLKRKTDKLRLTLVISIIASLAGLVVISLN